MCGACPNAGPVRLMKNCVQAATRDHHTFSRIYFFGRHFLPKFAQSYLPPPLKLRRIIERDHGVIQVPPTCRRIALGFLPVLGVPLRGRAKVCPRLPPSRGFSLT